MFLYSNFSAFHPNLVFCFEAFLHWNVLCESFKVTLTVFVIFLLILLLSNVLFCSENVKRLLSWRNDVVHGLKDFALNSSFLLIPLYFLILLSFIFQFFFCKVHMNVSFFSENVKRPLSWRNDVVHGLKDFSLNFSFLLVTFYFLILISLKYFNFSFAKFMDINVSFFSENVKRLLSWRNDVVHGLKDFSLNSSFLLITLYFFILLFFLFQFFFCKVHMNVSFFSENVKRPLPWRNDVVHGLKDFSLNFSFLLVTFYFLILLSFIFSFFLAKFIWTFRFFPKTLMPFVMKKRCRSWFKGFFFTFQFLFVFALYLFYFISFLFVTFWYFIFFVFTPIFVMHH